MSTTDWKAVLGGVAIGAAGAIGLSLLTQSDTAVPVVAADEVNPTNVSLPIQRGTASVVLGAQWGDEGKGKLVDVLAEEADIVARVAGGNNAGHTVVVAGTKYDFHVVPSGILSKDAISVIGNGVVLHIQQMFDEIEHNIELDTQAGTTAMDGWEKRLIISDRTHIVLDLHQQLDGLLEAEKAGKKIGTTKRGIGPVYSTKMARTGLRIADLVYEWAIFEEGLRTLHKHAKIRHPSLDIDVDAQVKIMRALAEKVRPLVRDTLAFVHDGIDQNRMLIEGANAAMLDIDFGSYPFVTSSSTTVGGVCTGLGLPPQRIKNVYGVCKAYTTRVGSGGFPTELNCEIGQSLQKIGHEYGVTTGRPRRCGWLDLVVLRHSTRVNGYTSIMLTKLDCLDSFATIKVAVAYIINGKRVVDFPANFRECDKMKVEYVTLEGWSTPTSECRKADELPLKAVEYIKFIERTSGVRVQWVGVGPAREASIRLY